MIFLIFELIKIGILMDDEPNSEGHYGRQVECTWVAHAFKNYEDLGQLVNCNS